MFEIERVTFVQTVRWPGSGVVEALTSDMWQSVSHDYSGVTFHHPDGYTLLLVPNSNIRWIAARNCVPPTVLKAEPSTPSETPAPLVEAAPVKRGRGRPRKHT